ncbi:MAG: hypothetical protein ACRCV4_16645, partial [Hafnia alvei]
LRLTPTGPTQALFKFALSKFVHASVALLPTSSRQILAFIPLFGRRATCRKRSKSNSKKFYLFMSWEKEQR